MTPLATLFQQFLDQTNAAPNAAPGHGPGRLFLRLSPRGRAWIAQRFGQLVAESGALSPADLTAERIQSWLDGPAQDRAGEGSEALILGLLHCVSAFLRGCVAEGLLARHPAPHLLQRLALPPALRSPVEQDLLRFYQDKRSFKGNTVATLRWFRSIFPMFLRDTFVRETAAIDRAMVRDWITTGCAERQWKEKTVRNYLQAVTLFLDWAVENGRLPANPASGLAKPRLPRVAPRTLSQEEATAVLAASRRMPYATSFEKARAVAILSTFLFTGLRLSELTNLTLADLHLEGERPELFVRRGKGGKDRHIPLLADHAALLRDYLGERARLGRASPFLFIGLRNDSKIGVKAIPRLVKRLRHYSGVMFSPHMLRHTCATLLMQAGCSTREVQDLLGHASVATTERYTHVTPDHLRRQVGRHPLADHLGERGEVNALPPNAPALQTAPLVEALLLALRQSQHAAPTNQDAVLGHLLQALGGLGNRGTSLAPQSSSPPSPPLCPGR